MSSSPRLRRRWRDARSWLEPDAKAAAFRPPPASLSAAWPMKSDVRETHLAGARESAQLIATRPPTSLALHLADTDETRARDARCRAGAAPPGQRGAAARTFPGIPSRRSAPAVRTGRQALAVTVLITCAAATWFMAGLHWFVQVVHYPLFADVGTERFIAYHARHSERTTLVVLPAMTAELATSVWLVVDQPKDTSATLVLAGLALRDPHMGGHVPARRAAAPGPRRRARSRRGAPTSRASWVRTAAWTVHGVIGGPTAVSGGVTPSNS